MGALPGDSDSFSTFDRYDLFVRQTVPWIIASTTSGGNVERPDTQVICIAPDTILPGSRIPDLKFGTWEEENGAAGCTDWRVAQQLAVVVSATVSLGFILY
jgi:hypothetical protein